MEYLRKNCSILAFVAKEKTHLFSLPLFPENIRCFIKNFLKTKTFPNAKHLFKTEETKSHHVLNK